MLFIQATVLPTIASSLNTSLDDKITDDELKQIEKEIESMAPPEEEEVAKSEMPSQPEVAPKKAKSNIRPTEKPGRTGEATEKKQQSKSQREKPPRFEKANKRKGQVTSNEQKEPSRTDKAAQSRPKRTQVSSTLRENFI